jgi:hypothetical protein
MSEVEVIETTALAAIQRAEIDSQIATAKSFPRQIQKALDRVREMATLTEAIAEECHYSLPRTDKSGRRINIQGPSIRFAEILVSQWGNLRIASRVIEIGARQVVAQGVCLDLEVNVAYDVEVRKAIVTKEGKRYSEDVIVSNANACAAVAQRNSVLKAVPRPLWYPIYEATLKKIGSDRMPLAERWQRAVAWFGSRGVDEKKLRTAIGITRPPDLTQQHIQQLVGWRNAIEQDGAAVDEIFGSEERNDAPASEPAPTARPRTGRRRPPREVRAAEPQREPEPEEETAAADAAPEEESEETKAVKRKLVAEWKAVVKGLDPAETNEAREAGGIDMVHELCTLEQLEMAVRKASEIAEGKRE